MLKRVKGKTTVLKGLLLPMLWVIIGQGLLFLCILFMGGTLKHLDENACRSLSDTVTVRVNQLQNQLINNFSNISSFEKKIDESIKLFLEEKNLSTEDMTNDKDLNNQVIYKVSDQIVEMLRNTGATDAFIVLSGYGDIQSAQNQSGFYIRDMDPTTNVSDDDILMEIGSSEIGKEMGMPLDSYWMSKFSIQDNEAGAFFYQTLRAGNKYLNYDSTELGYWSRPFRMQENDLELITYTVPLLDGNHNVYGILGVGMSMDQIREMLPYSEINVNKGGAYIMAITDPSNELYEPLASTGQFVKSDYQNTGITFKKTAVYDSVYETSDGRYCGRTHSLNLYKRNSPFHSYQWTLVGLVNKSDLFEASHTLKMALISAFFVSIGLGIIGAVVSSIRFAKPITKLSHEIKSNRVDRKLLLGTTNIEEIDGLRDAIIDLDGRVRENASKLTTIIDMVGLPLGAIEYDLNLEEVFCTDQVFDLMEIGDDLHEGNYMKKSWFNEIMLSRNLESLLYEKKDFNYKLETRDGRERWIQFRTLIKGSKVVITVMDITQEVSEKQKIEYERDYDILTQLLNRRAFKRKVEADLLDGRYSDGAMIMWDLDNLKYVNDTYGHDFGDQYICEAANVFNTLVSKGATVGRMSGDEFLAFIPENGGRKGIVKIMEQLQTELGNTYLSFPDGQKLKLRASGGIAWYPEDGADYQALVRCADYAMYSTKSSEKGSYREFDKDAYAKDAFLFNSKEDLNRMIEEALVRYAFQPIVDVQTGEVMGYEALMRPQSRGLHSPDDVMRLARNQSKLSQIEKLTFTRALYECERQRDQLAGKKIFINSIPNKALTVDEQESLKRQYGGWFSHLVVEIIESEKTDADCMEIKKVWTKENGMQIAVDDFGAGFNTESTLLKLDPDYVKIDISLVSGITGDDRRQRIVQNILSYTKERNIRTIAEGVEHREDMETLICMGVDYLQGYYIGRPNLDARDIPDTVKQQILRLQL